MIRRILAVAASAALLVTGATTVTTAVAHPKDPKPTIVLVHGAFADGASWAGVTERLQRDGYKVVVPAVPLRSIAGDTSYLTGVLAGIPGPKVLVGHSYGGALITQLAGTAEVKSPVYVAAFIPQAGETIGALNAKYPGSEIGPGTTNTITYAGGADLVMKAESFRAVFAADLPAREAAVLGASQRPVAAAVFGEPVAKSAPASLPKYALIPSGDKAIPPAGELFMAERAGAHIVKVKGASHLVMLSESGTVTKLIEKAAH
ncbi:alpha/beta hydrolase [Kribbella qitaiheensis]|uniref:Alpha/beta hydrolase n=1 Tax=Kribbella qitaiheensis TaxID=1544730 RepID=A0A7G6WVI7_9ACTN|nr:alpha/beta hydrolase [Kribbella qitaiheensis]QNE18002.1 alpha/beta hydrolase [Kribbella qitaiheensis]